MSRLTDLIAQVKTKDSALGSDLEAEFRALSERRVFGLNFERHRPEAVELPQRPIRKGDKVRLLPPRGSTRRGDQRLWRVLRTEVAGSNRVAHLALLDGDETRTVAVDDLVVVAEFRDPIYPGLRSTGRVERGGDKPYHTVINAENYHALQTLLYTHRGKVDCIYIDPPYNTGAKDWKYNNDYVEGDDLYRHSKWLAFMERRLLVAKELLNPANSVLIVTIDEKEYLRLGMLVEQVFPDARMQMVSIVINPSGTSRDLLSRVEEYAFFVFVGGAQPCGLRDNFLTGSQEQTEPGSLMWESLLRRGNTWYRTMRPNLCYPVLVDPDTHRIMGVGKPFSGDDEADRPTKINAFDAAWPVRTDGKLGIWRKDGRGLMALAEKGYAYASSPDPRRGTWSLKYLMSGTVSAIESGAIKAERSGEYDQVVGVADTARATAKTVWNRARHNAGMHGSALLREFIPGRRFPFPKSLYAVEDALAVAVADNREAVILDFFAGSGTTAHAVMRLNRQDSGHRQCISVTNNEVAADEQKALRAKGLRPGDTEWEQWGICDYITKPRIEAAITGKTPQGEPIRGDYKVTDEFPMAEGFAENVEFFTLTYETLWRVARNRDFAAIAPLLWLRAGAQGRRIDTMPKCGWAVADRYGVLANLDQARPFLNAVADAANVRLVFVVTDDDRRFQMVCAALPEHVEPVRLYESYLANFEINTG
ncbi:MAG: site-specific DNA-methyltransferase, partial [Thermomicrobiales bacterium]